LEILFGSIDGYTVKWVRGLGVELTDTPFSLASAREDFNNFNLFLFVGLEFPKLAFGPFLVA